jgi:hypothetical protein
MQFFMDFVLEPGVFEPIEGRVRKSQRAPCKALSFLEI